MLLSYSDWEQGRFVKVGWVGHRRVGERHLLKRQLEVCIVPAMVDKGVVLQHVREALAQVVTVNTVTDLTASLDHLLQGRNCELEAVSVQDSAEAKL